MANYKILNMNDAPFIQEAFARLDDAAETTHRPPDGAELLRLISDYDVYFCSLKVKVTREVIDRAAKLKVIVTPSTGLDHIDIGYAAGKGIEVISLKNDRSFLDQLTATAELSWGLLLAVIRKIPWGFGDAVNGVWARDRYRGMQLSGKTLGVLGYGRLGSMVADYGRAFRMRTIACDLQPIHAAGVEQVDFPTLLCRSDVLSIHIHLTPENTRILDRAAFQQMKDGIVIINISRGAIIDEDAFLEALQSGKVAAAGLDVVNGEWSDQLQSHPLIRYAREHQNLLITPHVGGITIESNRAAYVHSIQKLEHFFQNYSEKRDDIR